MKDPYGKPLKIDTSKEQELTIRPFQEEVFKKIFLDRKTGSQLPQIARHPGKRIHYGYDVAEQGGDKTVITRAELNTRGGLTMVTFSEISDIPNYKWYRNPVKWWTWRRFWKKLNDIPPHDTYRLNKLTEKDKNKHNEH
jgi:hypothetical protein